MIEPHLVNARTLHLDSGRTLSDPIQPVPAQWILMFGLTCGRLAKKVWLLTQALNLLGCWSIRPCQAECSTQTPNTLVCSSARPERSVRPKWREGPPNWCFRPLHPFPHVGPSVARSPQLLFRFGPIDVSISSAHYRVLDRKGNQLLSSYENWIGLVFEREPTFIAYHFHTNELCRWTILTIKVRLEMGQKISCTGTFPPPPHNWSGLVPQQSG